MNKNFLFIFLAIAIVVGLIIFNQAANDARERKRAHSDGRGPLPRSAESGLRGVASNEYTHLDGVLHPERGYTIQRLSNGSTDALY